MRSDSALWRTKQHFAAAIIVWVAVLIWTAPGIAQTTLATIRGYVADASGAVIPNAAIEITDVNRNASRSVVSNVEGDYEIPYLNPGTYRLICSSLGFQQFVANDVVIVGNELRRVDVQLRVGSTQTRVVVIPARQ